MLKEPEQQRKPDGYKLMFDALAGIEKEVIIRKAEAFDKCFERSSRRRGMPIDRYLRQKAEDWQDLVDLGENTKMSEDMLAYFPLH